MLSLVARKAGTIGYVDFGDAKGYPSHASRTPAASSSPRRPPRPRRTWPTRPTSPPNGLVTLNYNSNVPGAYPAAIFSYMLARTDGKGPNGLGVRQFADYVLQKCGPSRGGHASATCRSAARSSRPRKTLVTKIK